jgi:hypothetical protein
VLGPRFDAVVAWRQPRVWRDQAHLFLPRPTAFALDVPSIAEHRVVLHDEIMRRLMRCVAGTECQPGQPGLVGPCGDMLGNEADRLIDEIFGEVIAAFISAGQRDAGIVADQLRRILIGLRIHEAIVAIEPAPERPAVEWTRGTGLGQRRDVPFAEHVVAVAVRPQHLGDGAGFACDLAAIARIAAVEIGEAADADGVMIASGQQCRTRRRAHRRGVEAGIAQARRRESIDGRRRDRRTVAAEIREADIVEQNDEDVRRAFWRAGRGRPERGRVLDIGTDPCRAGASFARFIPRHRQLPNTASWLAVIVETNREAVQLAFAVESTLTTRNPAMMGQGSRDLDS